MSLLRLALYQPEIAQNVGTLLRLGACLGVPIDIIEPTGFPWNSCKMRRAGMDYIEIANATRHQSFDTFFKQKAGRIVLFDVKAQKSHYDCDFLPHDIIMVGRESCGVPDCVFDICEEKVRIHMVPNVRSLNVAISAAIGISEAIRQLR
ncbi:MAG: tRNA methyltransferase [Holosporales bacterium]|jgi:tRNA (cytidine/uridine-2'-O-)-methyltransferase|nr:tRNA methyltransferase [Holosporales bacterium]